jgi:hypothetical protein
MVMEIVEPKIAPRERVRDRVVARLRSRHLDLALAEGAPAEASAPLALRARHLTRLARRRALADTIVRVLEDGTAHYLRVSAPRSAVQSAADELASLAGHLTEPGPVAPRGVAEALVLLTDGTGPLYNAASAASLRERALSAARNLELAER